MARYKIYPSEKHVVVVSRFAGKPVRGIAKCAPDDTYNEDFGIQLAKARCDLKVAEKRVQRSQDLYNEALRGLQEAEARLSKMRDYVVDAAMELSAASELCDQLETSAFETKI